MERAFQKPSRQLPTLSRSDTAVFELSRRGLLAASGLGMLGVGLLGCSPTSSTGTATPANEPQPGAQRRMPAEWDPHARTVMSWPTALIWSADIEYVREDIANIARAIAEFEPVTMLASPADIGDAAYACGSAVEVIELAVDDLWARDTVPVFVEGDSGIEGVDFNFNGWGGKQEHPNDAFVGQKLLRELEIPRLEATLIGEGGSFETDGLGTLFVTESSLVNDNRNPGLGRDEIEARLMDLLGMSKVIWFDGVYGQDITDAHIDSLVRFTSPGFVLLDTPGEGAPEDVWSRSTAQARSVLSDATDANGDGFEVIDLPQPDFGKIRGSGDDFLASYVNFYVGNGAVFLPQFGDRLADDRAQGILQDHFPNREIVPLVIDSVASGGGGIHCATHDVPSVPEE